ASSLPSLRAPADSTSSPADGVAALEVWGIMQDHCTLNGSRRQRSGSRLRTVSPSRRQVRYRSAAFSKSDKPRSLSRGKCEQASAKLPALTGSTGAGQQLHDDGLRRPDRRAPREMVLEGSMRRM